MTPYNRSQGFDSPVELAQEADFFLGRLRVQPSSCRVVWGSVLTNLQPKVMKVLVALAQADGSVVSREELIKRCWSGIVVGDNSIQRCVVRLRKLSDDTEASFVVETQARIGYRLKAGQALDPQAPSPLADASAGSGKSLWPNRSLFIAALGGAALVLGVTAFKLTQAPKSPYLLAVRDFRIHNTDETISQSMSDRIANAVADGQLPIVSRERSKVGNFDGAHYILNGDVQVQGGLARAVVDMDDAASGITVWSTSAERPAAEMDELQDQVAGKVVDQLGLLRRFLGAEGAKAKPEAVATLIKATEYMRQGSGAMLETRDALQRFRDLEPNLSRAHSAFAMATALGAWTQPLEVAKQWRRQATDEARHAIELDPHNGEGYMALGVLTPWREIAQRERLFREGLVADPNDPSLFDFLGDLLLGVGRVDEALRWIDRSVRADPFSSPKTQSLIVALATAGQFDKARPLLERANRLWPYDLEMKRTILFSSLVYAEPNQALGKLKDFQLGGKPLASARAAAWSEIEEARLHGGRHNLGRKIVETTSSSIGSDDLSASVVALSLVGDQESAFKILEMADTDHLDFDASAMFGPAAKRLRNDARLEKLDRQLALAQYWSITGRKPDFCSIERKAFPCV